jgi:homoaconitase/3-isopropylmalate dehydratase large subunit
MAASHAELGFPEIWRNDRFWLAGDHVVHLSIMKHPKIAALVNVAEKAKKDFKMTEYQGMNYTIMHTEFVRERAEPGMLILGSDSHTCSAGAVGSLSIGLRAADVMMALATGEIWLKVPESILINFVGMPAVGMSGKDVILYILKELKRNTVAADRIVEFVGEGARHLSSDARFAICNMCTEFGAVSGLFVPDSVTSDYTIPIQTMWYQSPQKQGCTWMAFSSAHAPRQKKSSCWQHSCSRLASTKSCLLQRARGTTYRVHCQWWRSVGKPIN